MLRKIFSNLNLVNNFNSQRQAIHLSTRIFDQAEKDKKNAATEDKGFEEFEQPKNHVEIKQLKQLGLVKENWNWPKYNRTIYPPQEKDEPRRNAYVHHMRSYIKYPPEKMWYSAAMVTYLIIHL